MPTVERLSITLPIEMARMIRDKVEEGRYASDSEVIREAMRAWQENKQTRLERLAVLRVKIEEAETDPRPSLTEADLDNHFAGRLALSLAASKDHA